MPEPGPPQLRGSYALDEPSQGPADLHRPSCAVAFLSKGRGEGFDQNITLSVVGNFVGRTEQRDVRQIQS